MIISCVWLSILEPVRPRLLASYSVLYTTQKRNFYSSPSTLKLHNFQLDENSGEMTAVDAVNFFSPFLCGYN